MRFSISEKTRKDPLAASAYFETLFAASAAQKVHLVAPRHDKGWVLSTSFTRSRQGVAASQGKCGEAGNSETKKQPGRASRMMVLCMVMPAPQALLRSKW